MMGIFIKGMGIPKDSKYVDVRIFRDGTATTSTAEEPFYKRMDVIELPKHGRLIDADALKEDCRYEIQKAFEWEKEAENEGDRNVAMAIRSNLLWLIHTINHLTTIIEAEGET